jgi:DNA-binding transcriptional ArsR family regulator
MESTSAAAAFAALAHENRLAIFRALVAAGPEGMAAGEIAAAQGLAASTLSQHLAALDHAGLVTARAGSGTSSMRSASIGWAI